MVQKIGRGGNEGGNEGGEGKGRKRRKRKRRRRKRTKKRMKRRTKRTKRRGERRGGEGRGGGGGSLSKISSEETLSKLRLKLNQNKAKSTKHAGRPADLFNLKFGFNSFLFSIWISFYFLNLLIYLNLSCFF